MTFDKGGISALRTSTHLDVSRITAHTILRKIRQAMAHRDSIYRLSDLIGQDDTVVGGKRFGKRGRRAEGRQSVLVAVETLDKGAGFVFPQKRLKPTAFWAGGILLAAVSIINPPGVVQTCSKEQSPNEAQGK